MADDFKFMSVEKMCEYLWDIFVVTGKTLRFYFDIRINISAIERYENHGYLLTICSCDNLYISVITRDDGKEIKARAIDTQTDFVKFVQDYCNKYNLGKWKDTVCVDLSDWE